MTFWGALVEPDKPYTLHRPNKLRITQATFQERRYLWLGRNSDVVVGCSVGTKAPVSICSLSKKDGPHSIQLDLEFNESEDVVFSVRGPGSIHLAGYYTSPPPTATPTSPPHGCGGGADEDIIIADKANNKNELPMHASSSSSSKDNQPQLTDGFIDNTTHNHPTIEGTVELINGNNTSSKDFDARMVGNNEVIEQDVICERKSSQKEEMIIEKTERSTGGIFDQTCSSAIANTLVPPTDACKLTEKGSVEKVMTRDCVLNSNQDKVVDPCDSETLMDQGYVSASWTSDESHCALAPPGQKLTKKRKEKSKEFKINESDAINALNKMPSESNLNIVAMDQNPRMGYHSSGLQIVEKPKKKKKKMRQLQIKTKKVKTIVKHTALVDTTDQV